MSFTLEDKQIDEKRDQNNTGKNRPQVGSVQTVSPEFRQGKKFIDRIITENEDVIKILF